MDIVEVFKKQIMEVNQKKMEYALGTLQSDREAQQKFRELADNDLMLERITLIIKESSLMDEDRRHWVTKRNELNTKREQLHTDLVKLGFESSWIKTIVEYEMEKLKNVMENVRQNAYQKFFGTINIHEIDIFDERWVQVEDYMKNEKISYINGHDDVSSR